MASFINLLKNENMKLYSKRSHQIMVGILIILILGAAILFKTFAPEAPANNEQEDWKQELRQENAAIKKSLAARKDQLGSDINNRRLEMNNYRLEHDIKPIQGDNVWTFVKDMIAMGLIVGVFTIIVAGGMVANEFKWGTIKLLLIRPISRTKILLSKYVTTLLFAIVLMVLLFLISFICGALFFGIEGIQQPMLLYQNGEVKEMGMVQYTLIQYGFQSVALLMTSTIAFMISSIFRSGSLAIGIAIFIIMAGSTISMALSTYEWSKYILFLNTNLSQYFTGTPLVEGMTLAFSITVIAIYYIIFMAATWFFFTKRDVAA